MSLVVKFALVSHSHSGLGIMKCMHLKLAYHGSIFFLLIYVTIKTNQLARK